MWTLGEGFAEMRFQQPLDAGNHEADDGGRGIDDAVGVRHLDAEALEELLIDGVEELLLGAEVGDGGGGVLDGAVEAFEGAEVFVAAVGAGEEGIQDRLNLAGDGVAADEVVVLEDGAQEALGEEVLDEHFLDGLVAEVGVEGGAAEGGKVGEGSDKGGVGLALGVNDLLEAAAQVGDLLLEVGDGLVPFLVDGLGVGEELVDDLGQVFGIGEIGVEGGLAVLEQEGAVGGLEEDVGIGVALVELAADFGFQVIVGVLGLPVTVDAPEGVAEGGVHDDAVAAAALHGIFGFEGPATLAGGGAEEVEKRLADGSFAGDAVLVELSECGVIGLDELVSCLEAGLLGTRHGRVLQEGGGERQTNDGPGKAAPHTSYLGHVGSFGAWSVSPKAARLAAARSCPAREEGRLLGMLPLVRGVVARGVAQLLLQGFVG